jgi:ribosome-associated translation inhibitor RaiA
MTPMRVLVSSHGESLDTQVRTYAEYRIFATLSTHDHVLGARVTLRATGSTVRCAVHVTLATRRSVHARTSAPHAAAAIDRAAERIAALMDRQRVSATAPSLFGGPRLAE